MSFFSAEAVEAFGQFPMVRCSRLLHHLLRDQPDLFPSSIELPRAAMVLDVAARSGEWVREVARAYPESVVLGLARSEIWVEYARVLAHEARVGNVGFLASPLTDLLAQSHCFDLVRACCVWLEVPPQAWPTVLHEWVRVCAHGGHILWIEPIFPVTTSAACGNVFELLHQAIVLAGYSPSITEGMESWLSATLGHDVQVFETGIDLSYGTKAHVMLYEHLPLLLSIVHRFLRQMQVASGKELRDLSKQITSDVAATTFTGSWSLTTVVGEKRFPPEEAQEALAERA
jgi:ubiquinone/menaquinone biosynthesis C-methylase UbiE